MNGGTKRNKTHRKRKSNKRKTTHKKSKSDNSPQLNITTVDKKYITPQVYSHNALENDIIEKELDIVNENVDELSNMSKYQEVNSPIIKDIITIIEEFLRSNKLICYGGTAINNILPFEDQFYDYTKEIPDYDFFSKNAIDDVGKLADIYIEEGFTEVEAKSGIHTGTYKLFVNFIPIADITQLPNELFDNLLKEAMDIDGISYAPPDYLRMSMYLELSRPRGDVSRWEKVTKRLSLLNKSFPMVIDEKCHQTDFSKAPKCNTNSCKTIEKQQLITLKHLMNMGVVFFGGYASSLYATNATSKKYSVNSFLKIPYYDVISKDAERDTQLLKAKLKYEGMDKVKIKKHTSRGEDIPDHYEVRVGNKIVAFLYQAQACHNYNVIRINDNNVRVATIDTMLNMYLVFIYTNEEHLNNNRIMCMAKFIFDLHRKNRLNQKGLFRRFNLPCLGKQQTIMDIRRFKTEKYEELKNNKNDKEFKKYFYRYIPEKKSKSNNHKKSDNKVNKTQKKIKSK